MSTRGQQIEGQLSLFDFMPKTKRQGRVAIDRFLRYGPHTLIPEVAAETRAYLEQNGVPDWVTWDKDSYPCRNCTWYDGIACRKGFLRTHIEFGYLICDNFCQSITERGPSTVGDTFCSKRKEPEDDYIREHPTCFYVIGHYLDRQQGWHKVPDELPMFNSWRLVDVVVFGKKTGTPSMEHEKWIAKDGVFRSRDASRPIDSIEILAWRIADDIAVPLDIKGIMDDPYCPVCGRGFWTESFRSEVDCDRCPECGIRLDWSPWHRLNDEEAEDDPIHENDNG